MRLGGSAAPAARRPSWIAARRAFSRRSRSPLTLPALRSTRRSPGYPSPEVACLGIPELRRDTDHFLQPTLTHEDCDSLARAMRAGAGVGAITLRHGTGAVVRERRHSVG